MSGASKYDSGKPRPDLIYPPAILEEGAVLLHGLGKYGAHNWTKGMAWSRMGGAMLRHLLAWISGESVDAESGLRHLAHLRATAAFLMAYEDYGLGEDDRLGKTLLAVKAVKECKEAQKEDVKDAGPEQAV